MFEKIELLPSPYDEEDEILFIPRWTNTSLEDCSTSIPGLNLPDEESLIVYDAPESNIDIEDDLDSSDSTYDMIKKNVVEYVLNNDDDDDHDDNDDEFDDDDDYHNFLIMVLLVQHGDDDGYVGDDEVDDFY